jgi:hypothetical protein
VEFAWEGNDTKRMHLGRAAQLGMESAFLARAGFTGPSRITEGRFGFYNAFSLPGADLSKLTDGLGSVWRSRRRPPNRMPAMPPSKRSYTPFRNSSASIPLIRASSAAWR